LEQRRPSASWWKRLGPSQLFIGSFLLLIAMGTVGFKVLPGLYTGEPLSWLNAVFTATSAVCVTGLIVVDTETFFTTAGQGWILLLIQLGGLGMITFTSLIIVALGRRLSLRSHALSSEGAKLVPDIGPARLTRNIVLFTVTFEVVGALFLYARWVPTFGWEGAIWPSVFQAISAFCNAGFSTFSTSLMTFNRDPWILGVIMVLIVLGGIGFLSLDEFYLFWKARRTDRRFRLSLHSKLVFVGTVLLLAAGWIGYALLEWHQTLAEMAPPTKLMNSLFASVTARTAGFNTLDYGQMHPSTDFLTILLMSIGGSPGSTAGGIKTTTFMLLGLVAWSRLAGYEFTTFLGRSVPEATINRAIGLFVVAVGVVTAGIFVFSATELPWATVPGSGFLYYMFEASSAFNTVGLSMGVTTYLSDLGRLTTILMMFIGRVGPLTVAAALARPSYKRQGPKRYAYEDVVVG
jgi:trk system potassium uptake protein TrkH